MSCLHVCAYIYNFYKGEKSPSGKLVRPRVDFTDLLTILHWLLHNMSKQRQEASYSNLSFKNTVK